MCAHQVLSGLSKYGEILVFVERVYTSTQHLFFDVDWTLLVAAGRAFHLELCGILIIAIPIGATELFNKRHVA